MKKKGVTVKVSNRSVYGLIALGVLLLIGGIVFATNSGNPAVMGHTADEIQGLTGVSSPSSSNFGVWTNKATNVNVTKGLENITEGQVYVAQTDGFLNGEVTWSRGDSGSYVLAYTGSTNPPTVQRGAASVYAYYYDIKSSSFNIPVKKGDYFKVVYTVSGAAATRAYYWMPVGA